MTQRLLWPTGFVLFLMLHSRLSPELSQRCCVGAVQPADTVSDDDGFRPPETDNRSTEHVELPAPLEHQIRDLVPLDPRQSVRLDIRSKRIFLVTKVVCRNCVLEMLCVPRGQREHETILSVDTRAVAVHTALLAIGLKPGRPAVFFPAYRAPSGPPLQLTVHWIDDDGRQRSTDARNWIRHSIHRYFSWPLKQAPPGVRLPHEELRYDPVNQQLIWYGPMTEHQRRHLLTLWDDPDYRRGIQSFFQYSQSRPMTAQFVFTGSRWETIADTSRRVYAAEDGHLITVANFSSSTIDVAEASSASDGGQLYEAWEERIPAEGTPVLLEISHAKSEPGRTAPSDAR